MLKEPFHVRSFKQLIVLVESVDLLQVPPEKFKSSDGVTKAIFKHFSDFAYHNIDAFKKMIEQIDQVVCSHNHLFKCVDVMISKVRKVFEFCFCHSITTFEFFWMNNDAQKNLLEEEIDALKDENVRLHTRVNILDFILE